MTELAGSGAMRRNLLYSRLITLMQLADESAAIAYPRRLHMPDLHRQLIVMIGMFGDAISKDLVIASGREKAQISRGLKALAEAGLVDRSEKARAIRLNAAGRSLFADIMKVARERDDMLRKGFSDREVVRLLEMTATLIDRAFAIFVADEQAAGPPADRAVVAADRPGASLPAPSAQDLVLPWLQSLLTYMRRSGTILFKREIGLSNFEWRLLSLIEENQPLNLSSLIALVGRDKSQVARVVKQLHVAGLIDRHDEGRINAALTLTAIGRERYDRIFAISAERDHFLFDAHCAEDRAFYMEAIERLTANADEILGAEEAVRREKARASAPQKDDPRKELRLLREENARLKQLLAEAALENAALRDKGRRRA